MLEGVIVMLVVGLISFSMFNFLGDPVHNMAGENTSLADREKLREDLGLNDSIAIQYVRFVGNVATGELGTSYRNQRPVLELFKERLPATLELTLVAAFLALAIGIPMGIYTGLNRHGVISGLFQAVSLIGISLPTFVTGILLILIFSVEMNLLPSFGRGQVTHLGWWTTGFLTWSGIKALILPAITLCLFQMTLIMRLVRGEMLEVLRTDYIKFARARGLKDSQVHFRHALKNTLAPVITIVGLQIGSLIAFAIITETVFQWPGLGLLFIQAVSFGDVPVMAAYLVFIALVFVVINLIVDIINSMVDPRIRVDKAVATGHST